MTKNFKSFFRKIISFVLIFSILASFSISLSTGYVLASSDDLLTLYSIDEFIVSEDDDGIVFFASQTRGYYSNSYL